MLTRCFGVLVLLAGTSASAQAFVRSTAGDAGFCTYWGVRSVTYHLDAAGSERTPGDTEFAAIEAAFQSWQTVSNQCSDFQFVEGNRVTDPQVGYDKDAGTANQNVITFREHPCADLVPPGDPCLGVDGGCANAYRCWDHPSDVIALTITTFSNKTGAIVDADMELNASFLFTTVGSPPCTTEVSTSCVVTDVQNTVTHEIGHLLGLAHTSNPDSTMNPSAEAVGETDKRVIDIGTAQGFCAIYPPGRPSTSECDVTDHTSEQIVATSAGTAPLGCAATGGGAGLLVLLSGALGLSRRRRRT